MVSSEEMRQTIAQAQRLRYSFNAHTPFRETYYAPEIYIQEPTVPHDARTEDGAPAWASSATPRSAAFDTSGPLSNGSMSTSPPLTNAAERVQVQVERPAVLGHDHPLRWLPCEFMSLTGCSAAFPFPHINSWIDHMVNEHLTARFPEKSICWFCEEAVFECRSGRADEKRSTYRQRMYHIAGHFYSGETAADVKPDFFFLNHLHQTGLINDRVFQAGRSQGQIPAAHMPHDCYDDATTTKVSSNRYSGAEQSRSGRHHSSRTHRRHRHRH